ncbi:MAG: glycosyltransferase [Erysipelotrichales bacterium]|nr:glycosyltransferase [Erysipelotrichales bacterium]
MKRILCVSTYGDFFWVFEQKYLKMLIEKKYEIVIAANCNVTKNNMHLDEMRKWGVKIVNIPYPRKPSEGNILKSYIETRNLIKVYKPDIVDVHLSVVGAICRVACLGFNEIKVIYSPHGFFFYKGAPLLNNILYKFTEYLLSYVTDYIITINEEDYKNALKMKVRGKVFYLPGVGVDVEKIKRICVSNNNIRTELKLKDDDFIFLSVGELNINKNHQIVIRALHLLKELGYENIKYIICGDNTSELDTLKILAKQCEVEQDVYFLGYRNDIHKIDKVVDVFILPSFKEGLSVSIIEAMASGLPVIASDIRGNRDLIKHSKGGFLFNPEDCNELAQYMKRLIEDKKLLDEMSMYNTKQSTKYSIENVINEMEKIITEVESK